MAGPLGTTVFQVPKLGQTGFQIDQVNEQKRKAAQQQLQKEVSATGAEKAYMDNAMGLTGIYKQVADASFDAFRQAAIQYEQTGSSTDEARMKQAAAQLNYSVTAGRGILDVASEEYVKNKANGFKDVALSASEASELYTGFVNRTGEVIVKNGVVMVKDGDAFVPATQSTYLQSSVNLNNSFMLPRVIKQGTYVNSSAFVNEYKGAISAGSSEVDAKNRMLSLFNNKINNKDNKEFLSDVITSYAVNKLGMVEDPTKISADKYQEIQELSSDENIVSEAIEWYRGEVLNEVPPLWKATSPGGGLSIGFGTSKDIEFIQDETVQFTAMTKDKQGDWMVDDKSVEEVKFDAYAGFQSNLQGKSYTDAKKFKYDIVGIGVKDGTIFADKQAVEDAGFWSMDSGKQFMRKAEPMTRAEFTRLPTDTRNLLKMQFGEDLYKMLGEGSTEEEQTTQQTQSSFDPNSYTKG